MCQSVWKAAEKRKMTAFLQAGRSMNCWLLLFFLRKWKSSWFNYVDVRVKSKSYKLTFILVTLIVLHLDPSLVDVPCRNPSCCRATRGPSLKSSTTERATCSSLWPKTRWAAAFLLSSSPGVLDSLTCVPQVANAWYSVNGERLGTYNGHTGAVWCVDCDCILSGVDMLCLHAGS